MSAASATGGYGTHWARAGVGIIAGVALLVGMSAASIKHVLGFEATLAIINSNPTDALNGFSIASAQIHATDAGFGMAPVKQANGSWKNVLRAGFSGASISGLCLSKTETLPVVGDVTVRLLSPTGAGSIKASNGVFDITDIAGDTTGAGINLKGNTQIGLATTDITTVYANGTGLPYKANPFGSSDLKGNDSPLEIWDPSLYTTSPAAPGTWPLDPSGRLHTFGGGWTGIDAGAADLFKVGGRLWQVQLTGAITLPKLQITVTSGRSQCAPFPTGVPYSGYVQP